MTYKIIDTREKRTMTNKQEEAIMKAYERYDSDATTIKLPQKEHLTTEFRDYACCEHRWLPITLNEEWTKFLQKTFEETSLGDRQTICDGCKALALWESGELFAYDAIANAEAQEEKEPRKPNRKERR